MFNSIAQTTKDEINKELDLLKWDSLGNKKINMFLTVTTPDNNKKLSNDVLGYVNKKLKHNKKVTIIPSFLIGDYKIHIKSNISRGSWWLIHQVQLCNNATSQKIKRFF